MFLAALFIFFVRAGGDGDYSFSRRAASTASGNKIQRIIGEMHCLINLKSLCVFLAKGMQLLPGPRLAIDGIYSGLAEMIEDIAWFGKKKNLFVLMAFFEKTSFFQH